MMRTSLCMAAIALLCSTSAIAQTTGGSGSGSTGAGAAGAGMGSPGTTPDTTTPRPGETGSMGQSGSGTMGGQSGSGTMGGTQPQDPAGTGSMGTGSMGTGSMGTDSTGTGSTDMGTGSTDQDSMRQESTTGQSAMESSSGQNQNFTAFDQNQDGTLDRTEFARALQVRGAAPAAGGESGMPSRQTMRGDRAISPLNQSSIEFQRADTNGDGKISQEEFSSFSPQ